MTDKALTISQGGTILFRLFPSSAVMMPTNQKERSDVITALKSALDLFEGSTPLILRASTECD